MRTRQYAVTYAARPVKQKAVTANDLWNGSNPPTLGAGDEVRFLECKVNDSPTWFTDNSNNGSQLENGITEVMNKGDVNAKLYAYTEGITPLLTSAFGWEVLAGPVTTGSMHQHLIAYQPFGRDQRDWTASEQAKLTGYSAGDSYNPGYTFGVSEGPNDIIARYAVIESITLSCQQKQPLELELTAVTDQVIRDNAKTYSPNWSIAPNTWQNYFAMKDVTTAMIGPVGSMVAAHFTEFKVSVQHGIVKDTQTTLTAVGRAYPYSSDFSKLGFEATVFIHDSSQWKTWEQNAQNLAVKIQFSKGNNSLAIFITNMQFSTVTVDYANGGTVKLQGSIFAAPSTNNSVFTDPFAADHTALPLDIQSPLYLLVTDSNANNTLHFV